MNVELENREIERENYKKMIVVYFELFSEKFILLFFVFDLVIIVVDWFLNIGKYCYNSSLNFIFC